MAAAWQTTPHGVRLRVRVTPRGGRDAIEGVADLPDGPVLRVAVSAPPEGGKANAALVKLLAKALRVAKSDIAVAAGETSRTKRLEIAGDGATLTAMLEALADARR